MICASYALLEIFCRKEKKCNISKMEKLLKGPNFCQCGTNKAVSKLFQTCPQKTDQGTSRPRKTIKKAISFPNFLENIRSLTETHQETSFRKSH